MLHDFWVNFTHNLFKPLLLFFYMGFAIPLLRIHFEFPRVLYQSITMYLLISIGWHGGEELASVSRAEFAQAAGFLAVGFSLNFVIGLAAYALLRRLTRLRRLDAATVAGYYGSDSAGTFVTCLGVLGAANIAYAAYMPVMLAVMEIPGCLVALLLVSALRHHGLDADGNMPGEEGYQGAENVVTVTQEDAVYQESGAERVGAAAGATVVHAGHGSALGRSRPGYGAGGHANGHDQGPAEGGRHGHHRGRHDHGHGPRRLPSPKVLHEVFLNPGLYLLFGGIAIGFVSRLQGAKVTDPDDTLFVALFQGILCLFLLEMGMTACQRLRDLRRGGWGLVAFGLLAPNLFAAAGIGVAHLYSRLTGQAMALGTYVLFAVLCGSASYIAVPAVQRLAIPEASPTLPLAASLGLTFSYNVTVGIPVYLELAKAVLRAWPVT